MCFNIRINYLRHLQVCLFNITSIYSQIERFVMLYDNSCSYLRLLVICHKLRNTTSFYMENECPILALYFRMIFVIAEDKS